MVRRLLIALILTALAIPGLALAEDDLSIDECAQPGATCQPETNPTDAELEAEELAMPETADPIEWASDATTVACAEGATNTGGVCIADANLAAEITGGCTSSSTPGIVIALAVVALVFIARRRRMLAALAIAACSFDAASWDSAVDDGPTGDAEAYVDVYSAELGDSEGTQYLLERQPLASGAQQPVAEFSLLRARSGAPLFRIAGTCGDRLLQTSEPGAELLGWARAASGDGTAALVELAAPDGCAFRYETDGETIDQLVADGYTQVGVVAHVWPPGMGDLPTPDDLLEPDEPVGAIAAAPQPCNVNKQSAAILLYASPGKDESLRFLLGCPGEVIIGEKRESGPVGAMKSPEAHAAGGRTALVLDRHGDQLRNLLNRPNGVERTAQYLKNKLALGYDYIVIDEITAASDFRDGAPLNKKLRKLMLRMPARTVIPYISLDLTQYTNAFPDMKARRLLLRSFKKRARAIALEVYLHTGQVMAGAAPFQFRRAADRFALAVKGLAGTAGINRRAITTIGTSMHSSLPQYRYLDRPSQDLTSIKRQVNAIRHGSKRLRSQHGLGYYFVNKSDMAPIGVYSYDKLIRVLRLQARRFK